uniref:Uncharacterized protein n=1 Tax=Hucho hucho TaxID=62062 RepID=A0A4W5L4K8_9TELE
IFPSSLSVQGGECIYSCNDDADVLQDLDELAQHLRPYFLPSGSLLSRQQSSKVVLNELIQVIVSALLSSWDCPRSGQLRKTHLFEGRVTCEASLMHRDLLRNGETDDRTETWLYAALVHGTRLTLCFTAVVFNEFTDVF